jgi:hypothetical protein
MTRVTYEREGNAINSIPISVSNNNPYIKFNPEPLVEIIARRLVEMTQRKEECN